MIHSASFGVEERRFINKLNQSRTLADQADVCTRTCLKDSLGLAEVRSGIYDLKADLEAEEKQLFNAKEASCLDNCSYKMFASDKILRAYMPTRFASLKLNENELTKRLNNPNKEIGPYFLRKTYEDSLSSATLDSDKK